MSIDVFNAMFHRQTYGEIKKEGSATAEQPREVDEQVGAI